MSSKSKNQCDHIFRSGPLFPGHRMGGASLGRCPNDVIPGFVVCHEHVNKEALILMIRQLTKELEQRKKRKPEDIARKVLEPRIKVPLDDALANTTPSRCMAMYVHSAYEAVIEAIEMDREGKKSCTRVRR